MSKPALFLFLISPFISCRQQADRERARNEILKTEAAFEEMAARKGLAEAFWYFADNDAVIKRENDTLIKGKENIRRYYEGKKNKNVKLTWTPDFINVADCGTLGYTYGKYILRITQENGDTLQSSGVFHTVWKKQEDNSWKYVWD